MDGGSSLAMGSDGAALESRRGVRAAYGRERGRRGSRERPRAALYGEAMVHHGRSSRPRPGALPEAKQALWCVPGVLVGVVHGSLRGEEKESELEKAPHEYGDWRTRAALGYAC